MSVMFAPNSPAGRFLYVLLCRYTHNTLYQRVMWYFQKCGLCRNRADPIEVCTLVTRVPNCTEFVRL